MRLDTFTDYALRVLMRGGGLARPPEQINVAAVVRATEGSAMPAECFDVDHDLVRNRSTLSRILFASPRTGVARSP